MDQDDIKVSVICPTFNHEAYAEKAIDSILMQETDFIFEVLIGEDCSTDRTREVLKKIEEKIKKKKKKNQQFHFFYRSHNLGGTKNGYQLLKSTRGKYIAYLELDDFWTDQYKLQKQYDYLEKHSKLMGVSCNFNQVDIDGKVMINRCISENYLERNFTLKDFLVKGFVFQTSTLMHRNFFHDGNDYTIYYKSHELVGDLTTLSILLSRGDIYIMNYNMSSFRFVRKIGGTNARSIAYSNQAISLYKSFRQLLMLDRYFNYQIDYTEKKANLLSAYFIEFIKKTNGFRFEYLKYMFKHANIKIINKFIYIMAKCIFKKLKIENKMQKPN